MEKTILYVILGYLGYVFLVQPRQAANRPATFAQTPGGAFGVDVPGFGRYQSGPGGTLLQLDPRLFGGMLSGGRGPGTVAPNTIPSPPGVPQAPAYPEYPPSDSPLPAPVPEVQPSLPVEAEPTPADFFPPDPGPGIELDPCYLDQWCNAGDWSWYG